MEKEKLTKISSDKRQVLYDYWKALPSTVMIPEEKYEILKHDIRKAIVTFMRKGLKEKKEDDSLEERRRHALTAQEILDHLQKEEKAKIKLQTLYFHLQKLEEESFIQVVAILREGRHNVTYFGRTARGFVNFPPADDPEEKISRLFSQLAELAKFRNIEVDLEKVNMLSKRYGEISNKRFELLVEWLNKNEQKAIETDIDFSEIFDAMDLLDSANPEYQALYKEFFEILRLDPETWIWE